MSLSIKIAITPKASGQSSYEILDLIVVNGRAYLSLKDENTSAVTDTAAWMKITENTYDIAVRLGYVGTEAQWLASLSAASEAAAVIALDAAGDANDAATAANAAAGLAQDAAIAANIAAANITSTVPWSLYRSRVLSDSGVISDIEKLTKLYIENLKLLPNTVYMWDGSAGIKTRTSGANTYATNLYDMSAGNRDAAQNTEANQPFVGGGIAPNEKKRLCSPDGTIRYISHDKISFADGQEWAVSFALNYTGQSFDDNKIICSGDAGWLAWRLKYNLYFRNSAGTVNISPTLTGLYGLFGKTAIHNVQAKGGNVYWYINNQLWHTFTGINTAFSFQNILHLGITANTSINGAIYHYQVFNKALSASEIQAQYAYLRLQHPEIEGINIGNQYWATSNYDGVATGNGTAIPEVQLSTSTELITNEADRTFSEDTGFWIKSGEATIAGGVLNILSTTGAASGIQKTLLTAGKVYQLTYTVSRYGYGIIKSDSIDGAGTIPSSVGTHTIQFISRSNIAHIGRSNICDVDITDISFKEVGWVDLTTPAWCYYNNDPLNGAVYGKLYNWYAVQAIAANPPTGWRVPTQADFTQLATYLGGTSVAGGKMKKEGVIYFDTPNTDADNSSGFSAIGAGIRREAQGFGALKNHISFASSNKVGNGYGYILAKDSAAFQRNDFIYVVTEKTGQSIRLIRNEPVGSNERTIETGYITNALGATNLDISIPFGYQVESVRIDSETNITGLSAKLLTGALTELETLFTAKSVTANVQKVIAADADQSIQQTDAVVRINGTKADTTKRFRVWIKLTKVVFS